MFIQGAFLKMELEFKEVKCDYNLWEFKIDIEQVSSYLKVKKKILILISESLQYTNEGLHWVFQEQTYSEYSLKFFIIGLLN